MHGSYALPTPRLRRRVQSDGLYRSFSNRMAKAMLMFAAFTLWTNRGVDIGIQQLSFCQAFSILSFFATAYQLASNGHILPGRTKALFLRILWPSLAIITAITMSMMDASSVFNVIRFYGRWIYGLMFCLSLAVACRRADGFYKTIILCFLAGGVGTAILCASGYFSPAIADIVFQDKWSKRALGLLTHPNQLGMLYAGAVVLAFWPRLCPLPLRAAILAALLAGLLMTGSKFNMGMLILLVPMLLFWLPAREGRFAQAGASVSIGLAVVAAAIVAGVYALQQTNAIYYEKLASFLDDPGSADTTTSRFDLYSMAWGCTVEKPVFGIGAGNAIDCLPLVHAHNVFVNYMLETGLVGLCFLCLFFLAAITNCLRVSRKARSLPGTLAGKNDEYRMAALLLVCIIGYILSNCSSDSMGPATMPTLWLYIGLTLVLCTVVEIRTGQRAAAAR